MTQPCAWNLTRREVHYRHQSFSAGLAAAGYAVGHDEPQGAPGRVLLIWNRYGHYHHTATRFEAAGGRVVVAENGYIGRDEHGHQRYALSLAGHNGSGHWTQGTEDRLAGLGIALQPWRTEGDKIVVRGQRGIGASGMASPPDWLRLIAAELRRRTRRPVEAVHHPGNGAEANLDHERYLQGAHALVVWSSSVGVKALALGVPVFYCAPRWIAEGAAVPGIEQLEAPRCDDAAREAAFRRLAWAQWTLAEIESGLAFRTLLA